MRVDSLLSKRRRWWLIAALAITAPIAGTAYATATSAVTTSSSDTVVSLRSNTNLSKAGTVQTRILTVKFPAWATGTRYVLAAAGDLVNFGPSDYVRCGLVVNGRTVAGVAAMVGDRRLAGSRGPGGYVVPFSLYAGANIPAGGGTGALKCNHDTANGATPYVDAGATLWAHRTGSLKIGTE
jgi:hypothetical protein